MSTNTKTAQIGFYENGTTFTVNVDFVKNNGPDVATGVAVDLTIPAGLAYDSSGLGQGSYDNGTKKWTVGTLIPGQSVAATFTFSVSDETTGPWSIQFDVTTTGGCDSCLTNNNLCIVTSGIACSEISGCNNSHIQTVATTTHTVLTTEDTFLADASSNAVAFTLPTAAATYNSTTLKGQSFTFKVIDFTNGVSVASPGAEKIVDASTIAAAATTFNFAAVGESITLISDGTNFFIVSNS